MLIYQKMLEIKNRKLFEKMKKEKGKNCMGFYLVAHQTHASPAQRSVEAHLPRSAAQARSLNAYLLPPLALRLGPMIGSSARRLLPLGGVQRRRGSLTPGGGVGGSPSRLSPVASRPRLRPPRTGRQPCVQR
jgi:hypothetical protein